MWFDPATVPPVKDRAFIPSSGDSDGLSLIRGQFRARPWAALRPPKQDVRYRLAALATGSLSQLAKEAGLPALTIECSPDTLDEQHGEPWAHCVAVQINRRDYDADREKKAAMKNWAYAVAASLSLDCIEGPFDPPDANEPYRPA